MGEATKEVKANVEWVSFDAVYDDLSHDATASASFDLEAWRTSRVTAFQRVEGILASQSRVCLFCGRVFVSSALRRQHQLDTAHWHGISPQCRPLTIILVDDNFVYRSMRHDFFKLAREQRTAYGQIFLDVPESVACARNRARLLELTQQGSRVAEAAVSEETIVKQASQLEPPCPEKHSWERNSLVVTDQVDTYHVISWLLACCADSSVVPSPLPDLEALKERKEAACEINLHSLTHQADLMTRRVIAERMQQSREAAEGQRLNTLRKKFLAELKTENSDLQRQVLQQSDLETLFKKFVFP